MKSRVFLNDSNLSYFDEIIRFQVEIFNSIQLIDFSKQLIDMIADLMLI